MELTQEVLNDLFPHTSIEFLGGGKYKVEGHWCRVGISPEGADLELLGDVSLPTHWSFSGDGWEERFVEEVIGFESMSEFYMVGPSKQGSIHLPSSYCVTKPEDIKTHTNYNSSYLVWRGWESHVLLCSVHFHRKYLWGV